MVSRSSITLTEKCLPTSRSNSIADIAPVHSRLFSTMAPVGELSKSTNRSSCPRIRPVHSWTVSSVLSTRSPVSRGSPIRPVAPPARTIGRWPACWKRRSVSSGTRCPACRLGAVGSKPAYRVIGPSAASSVSASRSVDCAISPRQFSSSTISAPTVIDLLASGWRVCGGHRTARRISRWRPVPALVDCAGRPRPPPGRATTAATAGRRLG